MLSYEGYMYPEDVNFVSMAGDIYTKKTQDGKKLFLEPKLTGALYFEN
jgi:hypothetical protein